MEFKNINTGNIDSGGAPININIGDKNIFNDLTILLEEYKYQLRDIEKLLNEFKPKTALQQLNKLEERINSSPLKVDNITSSKILFVKALCQSHLNEFSRETSAQNFIKAYKKDNYNEKLRIRACLEYLFINEYDKALELAEEIIIEDEFNLAAWYVKMVTIPNKELKRFIKNIPEIVRNDNNFQYNILYHLILINQADDNKFDTLEEIENEYGIILNINFDNFKELRFENLNTWKLIIDLASTLIFNEYEFILKQISEKQGLQIEANITLSSTLSLLNIFINTLKDSEIECFHQKFYYNFFNYILNNDKDYVNELENIYKIHYSNKTEWFATYLICKVLINEKDYSKGLDIISHYETKKGELTSDLYYIKIILTFLLKDNNDIVVFFSEHLKKVGIIDEKSGINILNTFIPFFFRRNIELKPQVDKLLNSQFQSEELKDLLECSIIIKSTQDFDKDTIYKRLLILKRFPFSYIGKDLIAQNFALIGKIKDAINLLNSYIDKSRISSSLHLYIMLIYQQLSDKSDTEQGKYKELLELLKFWRINSNIIDISFFEIESKLYEWKNDWESFKELQEFIYLKDPNDLINFTNYLISLDNLKLVDKIEDLSSSIPIEFEDENIGLTFFNILIKNNIALDKSFYILYNLAINSGNRQARENYFFKSHLFKDKFFKHYKIVKPNYWVQYELNKKIQEIKITNPKDKNQNYFLNKKNGEIFTIKTNPFNALNQIKIINIYNDYLHLYYEIVKEAKNPINSLEIYNMEIPASPEEFNEYLKENFGEEGSLEKRKKEKYLNDYYNYRIGLTEITRVFREKYIDTYLYLTSENNQIFTTLPSLATINIDIHNTFILDFSTLILFYQLEKELHFKFKHKYILSYLVKENIEDIILEEKNSPKSELSLQITNEKVIPYFFPENYNQLRIDFFESLLSWINHNCIIDLVEEKLDIAFKLEKNNKKFGKFMKIFIDSMYLSTRQKSNLISSDSSLFLFLKKSNQQANIINPEKYLNYFYPEKCNTQFYRYLLKSNYLGVNINFEVIKNEFYDYLLSKENYYIKCLENLQFSVNGNPQIIKTVCDFIKELYLINSLKITEKNRYAFEIFKHTLYGMPSKLAIDLLKNLEKEFKLLGDYYIQVLTTFKSCMDFYKKL